MGSKQNQSSKIGLIQIKTEEIINEEKLMEAYEILRLDCEILIDNMTLIKNSQSCPTELLFYISRILYGSNRINNTTVPELNKIRNLFLVKYGQQCIDSVETNMY